MTIRSAVIANAHLPIPDIAEMLGISRRQVYYHLDKQEKENERLPSEIEKAIAEEFWMRGYTMNAIAFRLKVMPSALFSWKKQGRVTFSKRERPPGGFRKFWCQHPEIRLANPGLHQCSTCPQVPCDERREHAWWLRDKEFMEGKIEVGDGYVHV